MKKWFALAMIALLSGCCSSFGVQGDVDCGGSSTCYASACQSSCNNCSNVASGCSHRYGNTEAYCGRWGDPGACDNAFFGNAGADQSHSNWL